MCIHLVIFFQETYQKKSLENIILATLILNQLKKLKNTKYIHLIIISINLIDYFIIF